MKLGNKTIFLTLLLFNFFYSSSSAEDKITSTPLLNLNELKPSFEELEKINENASYSEKIKVKKSKKTKSQSPHAILIGLDKITAKSSELIVNFDQTKKFGPLEIRILKCGKVKIHNKINDVAYMQVKDLTKGDDEKVFIFNGWTFSSDPNITPFDHAIYDLQLLSCFNV